MTVTIHRPLLEAARRLIDDGHYAAAVVAAQTASEVFIERTFALFFEAHRADRLFADVAAFVRNFNLHPRNERLRHLYVTLSDDYEIVEQPFWSQLGAHVTRRNKIIHEGKDATREEADASYRAVDALIAHVERIRERVKRTTNLDQRVD